MVTNTRIPQPLSTVVWAIDGQPGLLTCVHCGGTFEMPAWQPRLRCPHCWTLGYPDRAGRNLLPLEWECAACGATNDGSTNFCMACGAGLASRCLRCEGPVYSSVCDHCGAHQPRLMRLKHIEAEREEWTPILRENIEQQQAREELEAHRRYDPTYGVREWRRIDRQMKAAAHERSERYAVRRRSFWGSKRNLLGWLWVLIGLAWLVGANMDRIGPYVAGLLPAGSLQGWLAVLTGHLSELAGITAVLANAWWARLVQWGRQPDIAATPGYAYMFGTIVFGLALLPVLLYVLNRIVHRLFP